MEAEDRVISEVHYFSKEAKCHETNLKGGKEDFLNSHDNDCKRERKLDDLNGKPLEEKEGDQYTCLLGSNGQVVLWSPLFETVLSRFEFSYPCYMLDSIPKEKFCATIDNDGDLEVVRKNKINKKDGVILIEQRCHGREHQSSTTLDLVGEQVWRGAFYLSDYILNNPKTFKGKSILELASGVGLTSIVAGMVCRKIITTDVDKGDILDLIDRNMKRNKDYCLARTFIKEIDFYDLRTMDDLDSLLDEVTVILAADVIYHNQLTDAFLNAVLYLMKRKPNKVMFIALEKRYVFTIEDMDTVAPCYEHFVTGLKWLKNQETSTVDWSIQQIPSKDLHQYFTYERTKDLVLWKIESSIKS